MKDLMSGFTTLLCVLVSCSAFAEGSALSLESFLEKVKSECPDFLVEKANLEAARARAVGVRIDPPMVGFMRMRENGRAANGYEISQEIPFPTKIIQDKKVRDSALETQKENNNYQKALILSEARGAYVAFWGAFEEVQILKEKHHWLKHHVSLTRTATRSDSLAQIHLLEVESDRDLIENEILATEAELLERRNNLKTYSPSLDLDSVIPQEPSVPIIEIGKVGRSAVTLREKELASLEAQEGLKKQAYVPDLFLRVRSFDGNEASPQNQEIMVGISLPFLFFWQPRAEVAEASAQRMKAQANLQKSRIEFETRLSSLSKRAESIRAQLTNLREKLIPRAETRRKLITHVSARTMEGLDEHKSAVIGLLDLRLKAVDLRLEYESLFKEILKLTGDGATAGGA